MLFCTLFGYMKILDYRFLLKSGFTEIFLEDGTFSKNS